MSLYTRSRKGTRQGSVEEISSIELGRNRRSTGSSGVVLGWHCNVSFNVRPSMFCRHLSPYIQRVVPNFLCTACLGFLMTCLLFFSDSSYSLLADDVLGSYLLCPHPKKPKCGSLIIRFPSGLVTHLIENTRKGKYLIEVRGFNKLNGLPSKS